MYHTCIIRVVFQLLHLSSVAWHAFLKMLVTWRLGGHTWVPVSHYNLVDRFNLRSQTLIADCFLLGLSIQVLCDVASLCRTFGIR